MKKITTIILLVIMAMATNLMANRRPLQRPQHYHDRGNSGVRLATDIIRLVGASLNILSPRETVVVNRPRPIVVAPPRPVVVYQRQPVIVRPAVLPKRRPVYRNYRPYSRGR